MQRVAGSILLCSSISLFGFEIKSVDLTEQGKAKDALPYTVAEDGKKIYKNIGKVVPPLKNQTIELLQDQVIQPIDTKIVYPIDSNMTHEEHNRSSTRSIEKQKPKDETESIFIELDESNKTEKIATDTQKVELKEEANKAKPINLEN